MATRNPKDLDRDTFVPTRPTLSPAKITRLIGIFSVLLTALAALYNSVVVVHSGEIVVKQGVTGTLTVWTDPGPKCQCFGTITRYPRSSQFWFSEKGDEGKAADESIKVRFNDGGHGTVSGSLRYEYPLDHGAVLNIHRTYGSAGAVAHELIRQVVTKSVYMTGPLMSSTESYASRRQDVLNYINDQVNHGVYRTEQHTIKTNDAITSQEKTATIVKIVLDARAPGGLAREEVSPIERYSFRVDNVTINSITYDASVEQQIQAQQAAQMQVQTAQAKAKEAEQRAITVEQEGKANAAKAKWEQEVEKAKVVTAAEAKKAVADLDLLTAEAEKQAAVKRGEGEARAAQLKMTANGALEQKLAAYVEVNKAFAAEIGKQRWVPEIVLGGSSGGGSGTGLSLIDMLQVQTARQLGLDMGMRLTDAPAAPAKK